MPDQRNLLLIFKLVVIGTWLVGAAGFLFPPDTGFGQLGRALFYLLLCVHLVECVFFFGALRQTGRPLGVEVANTLFFGIVHYAEVKQIIESQDASSDGGPVA